MSGPRLAGWLCRVACGLLLAAPASVIGAVEPGAIRQIEELLQEKENRTPVQRKIDSQLLYAVKAQRGERLTPSIVALRSGQSVEGDGTVLLDVTATINSDLLARVPALDAVVIHASAQFGMARLRIPLLRVEDLAGMPEVHFVQPAIGGSTFAGPPAVDPQGYIAHGVNFISRNAGRFADLENLNDPRFVHGNRAPIKIGVISDSLNNQYNDLQTASNMHVWQSGTGAISLLSGSGPVALPSESGSGSAEGLAMLEIIQAIAPGAGLYFATGEDGPANMADNIVQLSASGCQVIVDDYQYDDESPFQEGPIALAIDQVVKQDGAFYFSAAGDRGNLYTRNSGTWEGQFLPGGPAPAALDDYNPEFTKSYILHNFSGEQDYDILTIPGRSLDLFWSDPLGHSRNDYDLFLLSADGKTVEGASTNFQTGDQDPYEHIEITGTNNLPITTGSDQVVIVKESDAEIRCLHLSTQGGRLLIGTTGSLQGHAAARTAFCVGAASASLPSQASRPFIFSDVIEPFSPDGFRRMFFNPDGRLYTPEDYGQAGGILLLKPDFVAADDVTTTLDPRVNTSGKSLNPFYGTSAAAAQAAAIGALLRAIDPKITWREMHRVLLHSCADVMQYGVDRNSGAGALRADLAVENLKLLGHTFAGLKTTAPAADEEKLPKR